MINFKNIEYLKDGNAKQQLAYSDLKSLNIFENLKDYSPLLAGTIPLEIDLANSDLDIICECKNHLKFSNLLISLFQDKDDFFIDSKIYEGLKTTICQFKTTHFLIEIFAQNIPSENQNAFRHLLIEHQILLQKGEDFKAEIKSLKANGYKTEPAFAKLLGLSGNPYEALLKFK